MKDLKRTPILVNLDPANESINQSISPDIDINSLITVEDAMDQLKLGPNGALLYCMDYLDVNFDWLQSELLKSGNVDNPYFLFDLPGQVELFTTSVSMRSIIKKLTGEMGDKIMDLRLVCVNFVDSHYANDPSKFISILLTSLSTMLNLELPHINILSKIDLIKSSGRLNFGVDFYCDVLDLGYLVSHISEDPFLAKYKKLTESLAGLVQDYSLVSFIPLDINNSKLVIKALRTADKANGFYLTEVNDVDLTNVYNQFEEIDYNEL